jgi:hypothetical protein
MATLLLGAAGSAIGGGLGSAAIGYAIGSFAGSFIDNALFGKNTRLAPNVGQKLNSLKIQTSAYGEFIPQVFGVMRLGGNVIWATDIREVEIREEHSSGGGGKGGGGGKTTQTSIRYEYYATLAIGICEGKIDEVIRVWADSKLLTIDELQSAAEKYEVHLGDETQVASDIIKNHTANPLTVPAYRGLAYVVIEDFPLSDYGNRIPNFTFEVRRTVRPVPSVEDLVKDIILIPGSGEYVYSIVPSQKYSVTLDALGNPVQTDVATNVNVHNFDGVPNVKLALDQLQSTFPNLEWVAVVVNWFITSKNMGSSTVIPKIENADNRVTPNEWVVGGFTRTNAQEVQRFPDGSVTYGGTPTDRSIIELLSELKARGLKVLFYPMPLVDTTDEMAGEDDKPWRGRLIPTSTTECNNFFTKTNGYNAFIRHYAQLSVGGTALKNNIDAFVIGSELVGITSYNPSGTSFPGVSNLVTLAGLVKGDMPLIPLTYAADWTEYHSVNGYYHLDALWTSSNIDFVGIDNYMPLTPDLDQRDIDAATIAQYWEAGEGWNYYYADAVNRTGKTDYTPNDGTSPYAWKNIARWWNSVHYHNGNVGTPSGWTAKMKPVWFTEYGFPSVDGATNQPNVFVDPTSIESFYPRGSKRRIDFLAQRQAINATLEFWQAKNALTGNANLVPRMFLWTWDARPYPYFPDLLQVWADGKNWKTGHWVNGKFGISNLGAIVANILEQVGFTGSDYDVSRLIDSVEGYVINQRGTVRSHFELLRSLFFFDMVESDGVLKFMPRGQSSVATIDEDSLVPLSEGEVRETLKMTRLQELDLPNRVDLQYVSRAANYQAATQTAQRSTGSAIDQVSITASVVLSDSQARSIADVALYSSWFGRTLYEFMLPPAYAELEPCDVITLQVRGVNHDIRITSATMSRTGQQSVQGVSENIAVYDFYTDPADTPTTPQANPGIASTTTLLLDLPPLPTDTDDNGTLRIAMTANGAAWNGAILYRSDDGGEAGGNNFASVASTDVQAITGTTLTLLSSGPRNLFDRVNTVDVAVLGGTLTSKSELAVLNGANACVIGEEIVQFTTATLVSTNVYRLSGLLRGRLGTEHLMDSHAVGDRFVMLDSAVIKETMPLFLIGLQSYYKALSVGTLLADADEIPFTYRGIKFTPFSPVDIRGVRDGSGNLTITWKRRTRIGGAWRDGVDAPLSEQFEAYEIDIMNGATVVRIIPTSSQTATYNAAQQGADFGSTQDSVSVRIVQLSAVVGRGTAGIATL